MSPQDTRNESGDIYLASTRQGKRYHIVDLSDVEFMVGTHHASEHPSECGIQSGSWQALSPGEEIPEWKICKTCAKSADPDTVCGLQNYSRR